MTKHSKIFYIFSKYRDVAEKAIRDYSNTRIRYMTWQEEIDDMKAIAEEEKARADKAEARANKYEKMLRELGKL